MRLISYLAQDQVQSLLNVYDPAISKGNPKPGHVAPGGTQWPASIGPRQHGYHPSLDDRLDSRTKAARTASAPLASDGFNALSMVGGT